MNFSFVFLLFATAFVFVHCNHVRSKRDVNFTNVVTVDCSKDHRRERLSAWKNVSCQPYYRHVDLNPKPEQQLIPPSVFVRRCYGSSVNAGIVCVPQSNGIQIIRIPVSVRDYSSPHQQNQCSVVEVEEHLSCQMKCKQGPESCSVEQEYNITKCECTCIAKNDCTTGFTWDSVHCRCARD